MERLCATENSRLYRMVKTAKCESKTHKTRMVKEEEFKLKDMVVQKLQNLEYKLYSSLYLLLFKTTHIFTEILIISEGEILCCHV